MKKLEPLKENDFPANVLKQSQRREGASGRALLLHHWAHSKEGSQRFQHSQILWMIFFLLSPFRTGFLNIILPPLPPPRLFFFFP